MKNKFKKSKIIVPALALITATTAASVTGTVAWFTAARTATVTASNFESTSLSSTMKVTTTAGVGTSGGTSTAAENASITVDGKLTHGSYNAQANNAGNLYVANVNGDETTATVTSYQDYGTLGDAQNNASGNTVASHSKWAAEVGTNKVWYAVSWTMTFTLENTTSLTSGTCLFLDVEGSTFTEKATKVGDTIQGLRIAFMTSTNVRVLGGLETGESHVTKAGTIDKDHEAASYCGSFADGIYHKYGTTLAKAADADKTTLSTHSGYLGDFSSNSLTVTAVAWFEGEDNSIVKDKDMSKVQATLKFYSRNVVASN